MVAKSPITQAGKTKMFISDIYQDYSTGASVFTVAGEFVSIGHFPFPFIQHGKMSHNIPSHLFVLRVLPSAVQSLCFH
jgi:hypothetical protein